MTDPDTAAAVEALAHRLKARDKALRDGEDFPDAEVFASEYLTALRGHGWRPTEAKAIPAWKVPSGPRSEPPADVLRQLRADLDAKAATARQLEDGVA